MTCFYTVESDEGTLASGELDAAHQWGLPGIKCPGCGVTWSGTGHQYPSVDASTLAERAELEEAHLERDFARFEYLRSVVRPLFPPGTMLPPGTEFGPLVGKAWGNFGPFAWLNPWTLLIRRDVLKQLQAEGLRGLKGCRTALRFRQKQPPELLELEILPRGRLHADCLPERPPPCERCGRDAFTRPEKLLLDAVSLPRDLDLFRLANFATILVATERFAEAVRRMGPSGVRFREVPVR